MVTNNNIKLMLLLILIRTQFPSTKGGHPKLQLEFLEYYCCNWVLIALHYALCMS